MEKAGDDTLLQETAAATADIQGGCSEERADVEQGSEESEKIREQPGSRAL